MMASNYTAPIKTSKQHIWAVMAILTACCICYIPSLHNGWHRDDVAIYEALSPQTASQSFAQRFHHLSEMYGSSKKAGYLRPLSVFSFMVEEKIWGLRPMGFHLTSLVLHILASILVYSVVKIMASNSVGLLSAVFFAIHPIQFETVGLIHNRNDLFCLIFLLLSLWFFYSYRKKEQISHLILSLCSYVLALFSKETAVLFPLILVVLDHCIFAKNTKENLKGKLKTYGLYFLVVLVYFFVRKMLLGEIIPSGRFWGYYNFLPGTGLGWQPAMVFKIFGFYISLLLNSFSPFDFCADYFLSTANDFFEKEVFFGLVVLLGAVYAAIKFGKSSPVVFFAAVWFFMTYFPVSNIIFIGNMFSQHFMYVPSVGFFTIWAWFFEKLCLKKNYKKFIYPFLAIILICWARSTLLRNVYYKDDAALWFYSAKHPLASPRTHAVLGQYYIKAGDFKLAEEELKKTIDQNPSYHPAYLMLGYVYKQKKVFVKAKEYFLQAAQYAKKNGDTESLQDAMEELKSLDAK